MRYNLLRHKNKLDTTLFQTSLGISPNMQSSQGLKLSILSSRHLSDKCVRFDLFFKYAGCDYFAAFEDKIIDYGVLISKIVIAL